MASGDINIDGIQISPEGLTRLVAAVTQNIEAKSNDPEQIEVIDSLTGVTSIPVLQQIGNTVKLVRVLVSILRGVDGREVFLQVTETHIQWRYTDGMWDNLIALADLKGDKGETPIFRTSSNGIEWKYESEEENAWKELVSYETLKLKFTDLTSEQIDAFWRSIPEDVLTLFQKPATDAAGRADDKLLEISQKVSTAIANVNTAAGNAAAATKAANDAARLANEKAGLAIKAAGDANTATGIAVAAAAVAEERAEVANIAAENADAAIKIANDAARLANEKARLANTAATLAETAKEKAITATGNADTAAERANVAADGAEGLIKGFQSDWSVSNPVDPNYIKNKPEIPTLSAAPKPDILSYVNSTGMTVSFRIGDEVRVLEDGEYVFYRLYDLADGVASWHESGSGTALPGNIYLQGANYYNESITTIKGGYIQ